MSDDGKTKAVAVCEGCGHPRPVRVRSDGSIHQIGGESRCCTERSYRVVDDDPAPEFADDD